MVLDEPAGATSGDITILTVTVKCKPGLEDNRSIYTVTDYALLHGENPEDFETWGGAECTPRGANNGLQDKAVSGEYSLAGDPDVTVLFAGVVNDPTFLYGDPGYHVQVSMPADSETVFLVTTVRCKPAIIEDAIH